jgi:hypothetical protein
MLVAALVVVTLRCGTRSGDRSSVDGDASIADASSSAADGVERADTDKASSATHGATKPGAPRRRRTPAADEESPATTSTSPASPADPKRASSAEDDAASRSPYGAFTLVGENGAHPGRWFGESVAIDGDVAVIAAPGFKKDVVGCGAAFVYERKNKVWTETQRIDSPRPDVRGFARRVGVSAGRVVVFGGSAVGRNEDTFRSYVRDDDGAWKLESEVNFGPNMAQDAVVRGDTVAVSGVPGGSVAIWQAHAGKWEQVQRVDAPADERSKGRFGVWLSLAGDTLAVHNDGAAHPSGGVAYVYRRREGRFEADTTIDLRGSQTAYGTLARDGAALVWMTEGMGPLVVNERVDGHWSAALSASKNWGEVVAMTGSHPFASDGDLVVASSRDWKEIVVLQRRDDGWYRTSMAPARPRDWAGGMWPAWHPNVAISGRSVVVGTEWDGVDSGRAWFFDITDDDLARATKIESDAK